jgi:3-ketosteroid 9alpha-monooxygenase subunit B
MHHVEQFEVVVERVIPETADTVTLELFAPHAPKYKAGQFLTLDPHQFAALKGYTAYLEQQKAKKELVRAYSLCSAPHEKRLAFTIKEELFTPGETPFPPLLSPLLVYGASPGLVMEVTGFTGSYVLPEDVEARVDTVLHVVAGSGSVPNFGILKHDLHAGAKLKHIFIYSNRTHDDIIYRGPLAALARQHPERLELVHLLTRDPEAHRHGPGHRHARLSVELLRELVRDPARTEAFVCGPGVTVFQRKAALARGEKAAPRFIENALEMLQELGVPKKQVHHESYG